MKRFLDRTELFDINNYEFNSNSKIGIYLIHGFTSTTYELKKLIKFLASKNIFVRSDNLPGHGTTIEDCNLYKYTDWVRFSEQRFADLSSRCDKIFVGGISMGALLAMNIAATFPINGLISAAPVLEFNKPLKIKYLNPLFCHLLKSRAKKYELNPGQKTYYGYNKWPLIALNEVRKLSNYIRYNILNKIDCPTLLIHSRQDTTSIMKNLSVIKNGINSSDLTSIVVNKSHHNIFDCETEKTIIHKAIINFISTNS